MSNISMNEQECQQDALQRMNNWLVVLEERLITLLSGSNPQDLKPGEREQAVNRYLMIMLRLLEQRQKYARANPPTEQDTLLDALFHDMEQG